VKQALLVLLVPKEVWDLKVNMELPETLDPKGLLVMLVQSEKTE